MTKEKIISKVLAEMCDCYEDAVGNRPCDNGVYCDLCRTEDVQQTIRDMISEFERDGLL